MASVKGKVVEILLKLLFFPAGILVMYMFYSHKDQLGENYVNNLHLTFSGKVVDKTLVTGDSGMLYLDSVTGVDEDHDPRDSLTYYFILIIGSEAEFITTGIHGYEIGDSIYVDSYDRKIEHYRNGNFVGEFKLIMTRFAPLYNKAKKLHRL